MELHVAENHDHTLGCYEATGSFHRLGLMFNTIFPVASSWSPEI
jgi:hypothetical protein